MTSIDSAHTKPLGVKAYGSIPHVPGSRRGPGDHGINATQARICLERVRDKHDTVIVQNKLDGSNVAAALLNGELVALTRAGYRATDSPYEQHYWWDYYVRAEASRFRAVLKEGEWLSGEWLMQAHGTLYDLTNRSPFVAFDLWSLQDGQKRQLRFVEFATRLDAYFVLPGMLGMGPMSINDAIDVQMKDFRNDFLHGERGMPEGIIWRVERHGKVDFVCKYVRHEKIDGMYLPEKTGQAPVWNWHPKEKTWQDE